MTLRNEIENYRDVLDKLGEDPIGISEVEESGTVVSIDSGIAVIKGLQHVKNQELVQFSGRIYGLAFNLDPDEVGIILLGDYSDIHAGDPVKRTFQVASIPVSRKYLGRVIDPLGNVLDGLKAVKSSKVLPIERESPTIMQRAPVTEPLQTGIKVIDAIVPIGRGQRELILGDRKSGKTAIAMDTIINQKGKDVICIYCSIGQQISSVAKNLEVLKKNGAMAHTVVMVASSDSPPGVSYIAPYAATTLAEYFMEQGSDVLIIYDDLTKHARAYRELSILLERPSGREAYPGDIFYIHSRLLERSTHMKKEFGGGSITAIPIIETQAENISAYVPTNLISITDGQIYLSPKIFQRGNIPAVNVGTSVSRVGGKSQLAAYREITGPLKLSYSQFEELELFSSFSTVVDENTKKLLARGERIRKIFNQPQFSPM
ncbi:MAG TPA: F0F1 ATP synthase subunit alpha, partial [Bacteroidales bacterium]|nr:F0F1 ATP synthase subunit alpha [Bacteroidales bacterium]